MREFLRRMKALDPERYREVLRRFPVNQNVDRDEKSHELLTDFSEVGDDEDEQSDSVAAQVNRLTYRDWLRQQRA